MVLLAPASMEVCCRGVLTRLCSWGFGTISSYKSCGINQQIRCYAARKGTREKARKKKVKVEIQKIGFIAHNLRQKDKGDATIVSKRSKEERKSKPVDDVWISRHYSWRVYSFAEAVECHRETHHPTVYNKPDALVNLFIELDMRTAKPTKFVEKFRRMAMLPHAFQQDVDRSILAFCKTPEQKKDALEAGATLVGGTDIIRDVEKGNIMLPDFDFVVAHPSILPEMVSIKGLLKKKFPNPTAGTLGVDVGGLVRKFKNGVQYSAVREERELDYGWIDTPFGQLNMDTKHLEENFVTMLNDINTQRPKREGEFITRILMHSPPSVERLKLDLKPYLAEEEKKDDYDSDDDEDEDDKNVKVKLV